MAFAGPVRLAPWMKPYYRDTLHHVRRAKELRLLACLLSVVFPQFGNYKSCHDLVINSLTKRDRLAINGKTVCPRRFAMPCPTIKPADNDFDPNIEPVTKWVARVDKDLPADPDPLRRKPRFDDHIFIEE
eukprot:11962773-Heterocapsa_arctica.AAC.1